jgi:hypothetical protein
MAAHQSAPAGTSTEIMNMAKSRTKTASTLSTMLNPIKRKFGFKKRFKKRGTNALFRAISAENWELACTIADSKPYKAEAWHNALGFFDAHRSSRILPLHQSCIFHPTRDAIVHIIQAFPLALRAKESGYGRVPLHIACHSNASLECIQVLVDHYPDASIEQDIIGRVPLHYALSNGASYDIVKALISAASMVVGGNGKRHVCSVADFNGWLPIHVACFMGASAPVLALIVNAYPEGVDRATKKKSTPRGLLKGISMAPEKKEILELVLSRRGSPKYASRVVPVQMNMEKVVRMSDETCSKGVTLVIDEGETSSLSSMETETKSGLNKKSSRKEFGYDQNYKDLSPEMPLNLTRSSSRGSRAITAPRRHTSNQLPTHAAYNEEEEEEDQQYGQPSFAHPQGSNDANIDTFFPPPENKMRSQPSESLTTRTNTSAASTDGEASVDAIFQPITPTATFC